MASPAPFWWSNALDKFFGFCGKVEDRVFHNTIATTKRTPLEPRSCPFPLLLGLLHPQWTMDGEENCLFGSYGAVEKRHGDTQVAESIRKSIASRSSGLCPKSEAFTPSV